MFSVTKTPSKSPPPQPPPLREYGHYLVLNHCKTNGPRIIEDTSNLRLSMNFPVSFNLTLNKAFDQQNIGSCVANAFAAAVQIHTGEIPSRLYLYYNARLGCRICPSYDSGLELGRALPLMTSYGLPSETLFPYITSQFTSLPPYKSYTDNSIISQNITYSAIAQKEEILQHNLYSGNPIIFGINVYQSCMLKNVEKTGIIPYPNRKKERYLGGHCILMVGWTIYNKQDYFIIRNSWGTTWGNTGETKLQIINGKNGYAYIPKTYILDPALAFDFYAIKLN
jgi:C1A family cysteine protease